MQWNYIVRLKISALYAADTISPKRLSCAETKHISTGSEFTHTSKTDRIHPFDVLCAQLNITHKLIRPRTPWHNGKVERSHRSDQERFYNHLRFYSYDDLQNQMKHYLQRSNQIPMPVLGWMSPVQKREALKAARFCWFRSGSAFPASAKSFYNTLNFFIFFSLTSLTNVQ